MGCLWKNPRNGSQLAQFARWKMKKDSFWSILRQNKMRSGGRGQGSRYLAHRRSNHDMEGEASIGHPCTSTHLLLAFLVYLSIMSVSRRDIVRACKQRGWTIAPGALQMLMEYLSEVDKDHDDRLPQLLNALQMEEAKTVTEDIMKQLVNQNTQQQKRPSSSELQIINAFETPRLVYQATRRQFQVEETKKSLFGSAEDKINMLSQRYALIHQRILRHDLFRPHDLGLSSNSQYKLTPIESLLGKGTDPVLLLGILIQIDENQYFLEDLTGQVAVSFADAVMVDSFFVTEHMILLVEGIFLDGTFYIQKLGHPLVEARDVSLTAIAQQVAHPAFSHTSKAVDGSFVVMSDLNLDIKSLQAIEGLLASYENYSVVRLPVFVLMGNFGDSLEELGTLIASFSSLAKYAHFVIVPGPLDGNQHHVLPLPNTLSRTGFSKIQNVHWATNPCRIRSNGLELVVFRYDLLHLLQRQHLLLSETPRTDDDNDDHVTLPHCRMVKTVVDQGHLIPVSGVPIYWNYDHALRLYPLPNVLVMGGDGSHEFHEIYGNCHVVHPGSVARDGSYAVLSMFDDDDLSGMDDTDEDGMKVAFGRLGNDGPS